MRHLIDASTGLGGVVLDPFCGSGSTGVAAVGLGRRFLGVDIDPAAVALTVRRIDESIPKPKRAA
jgi:DNA modification methylase